MRSRGRWCALLLLLAGCELDDQPGGTDAGVDAAIDAQLPDVVHRCSLAPDEAEPNEEAARATPLLSGDQLQACVASAQDRDLYRFTTPATPASGGYLLVELGEPTGGRPELLVQAGDGGRITGQFATTVGQELSMFVAVAAGETYRVAVRELTGQTAPYPYTLRITFRPVMDAFEPNQIIAAGRVISRAQTTRATLFAGYSGSGPVSVDAYDDWYAVDLQAGATTVTLFDVPLNVAPKLALFDGTRELAGRQSLTPGEGLSFAVVSPRAGRMFVRVGVAGGAPAAEGTGTAVPDHFLRSYGLTVSQP